MILALASGSLAGDPDGDSVFNRELFTDKLKWFETCVAIKRALAKLALGISG